MKRVLNLILILCLISFIFVGCDINETTQTEDKTNTISEDKISENENTTSIIEEIMEEYDVRLFAKDIEFDMENNLNKEFFIYGTAELSNYYNYGFDENYKKDYFCIKIKPKLDTGVNEWYIYYGRKDGKKLYDDLLKNKTIDVFVVGMIPSVIYKKGQDNMALLVCVAW